MVSCSDREKNVAMDAFDTAWFDEVETSPEDGLYVISGGVFMYFEEEILRKLFTKLALRFPGGGICFDACNMAGLKKSNRIVKKSGNTGAPVKLAVNNAKKMFLPWSKSFKEVNTASELPQGMKEAKINFDKESKQIYNTHTLKVWRNSNETVYGFRKSASQIKKNNWSGTGD